jgi:hypothetical protein
MAAATMVLFTAPSRTGIVGAEPGVSGTKMSHSRRGWPARTGAVLAALATLTSACGGSTTSPSADAAGPSASAAPSSEPVQITDLAHAVVQIVSYVDDRPDALGSGTSSARTA